jgi:hypothetical protein
VPLLGNGAPGYGAGVPNASHVLSFAVLAARLGADTPLPSVRHAQHLLEPHLWTQIVQIDNVSTASPYPRVVYALIFQLDSALWFYTPADGTQSLSQYRGQVEKDKANLGPLLVAVDPGFTHYSRLPEADEALGDGLRLQNGCFIESITLLFRELEKGTPVENPMLLSYYVLISGRIRGHTVLQFTSGGKVRVIDPDRPTRVVTFRYAHPTDPEDVADRIRGDIYRARHFPLREFLQQAPSARFAQTSDRRDALVVQPAAGKAAHS